MDLCECDYNIKPSRVKTNSQQIYSRIYDPYKTSSNQKLLLQTSSKKSSSCLQLKVKVIVQVENSTTLSAKWFTFNADKFFIFHNQLADHISNKSLEDKDDYDAFINESQKLKKSTKNMKMKITDLDTPPTYPSFGLTQALKPNTQILQSRSQSTTIEDTLGPNFVSALQEYLDNLTNVLNSDR
ncbi:18988_t:CDS:2, partial [Racocetra fulgida]